MIDERLKEWRYLASIDYIRSPSRTKRGTGKLSAPTFSDRYFELMADIKQLQDALNQACDVIQITDRIGALKAIDNFEKLFEKVYDERNL